MGVEYYDPQIGDVVEAQANFQIGPMLTPEGLIRYKVLPGESGAVVFKETMVSGERRMTKIVVESGQIFSIMDPQTGDTHMLIGKTV